MWFGASEATFPYANTYMTIYTAGTFFALMASGLNYFINCQGFPMIGMATVLIGAISNLILDPIFIFGFQLNVAGAALATVLSQFLSCCFALVFLLGKRIPIRITFGQYSLRIMGRIVYLGFSPFLILATDNLILILMNTVLQRDGGPSQGDLLITCATIAQSYLQMITAPMIGISGGTQAVLSYNYGAAKIERIRLAESVILKMMLAFTGIMFLLSRVVPPYFVRLFTAQAEYQSVSVWAIKASTLMIIPLSFQYVFVDGLTALERPKTALALSIFRKSVYTAALILLPHWFSARTAFYAEPISDILSAVLSTTVFLLILEKHLEKRKKTVEGG
jgi:Na+-driven multidrug efflux pump